MIWSPANLCSYHRYLFNNHRSAITRTLTRLFSTRISLDYGNWEPVIGLEIHAQIASKSKLFSSASTKYESGTNCNVAFFDASLPGSLPVLNRRCVEAAILTGLSLNCSINSPTSFDRKHYFYPDLPQGFQITQLREPIAVNGFIDFTTYNKYLHDTAYVKRSAIKQIQLEQDSGKTMVNESSNTCLIDLNRAGIGLLELVFEPDLNNGEEASCLVRDLILILKGIKACSCKMEEGSLRVDANVSVRKTSSDNSKPNPLGVRTEIKNLNSLKSVSRAINHEIRRQITLLEAGKKVVNETRTFDAERDKTVVMRDKEVDNDYRFMPEPNLPPLHFTDSGNDSQNRLNPDLFSSSKSGLIDINDFRRKLRPSPDEERRKLMTKYHIDLTTAFKLLPEAEYKEMFEQLMDERMSVCQDLDSLSKVILNLFFNDIDAILEENKTTLSDSRLSKKVIGDVVDMIHSRTISDGTAHDLLVMALCGEKSDLRKLVQENDWYLIHDEKEIKSWCMNVIELKPKRAKEYSKKAKKYALNVLLTNLKTLTFSRINEIDAKKMFDQLLQPPAVEDSGRKEK